MNFWSWFYFLTPMDYSPWFEREIWPFLKANKKGAKYPKPEVPRPPKMICIHFTSTSTCMNFLSGFYFLLPMNYSPWSEGKIWLFWRQAKKGKNLRNQRYHAHQSWFACVSNQPLLAWIFWASSIFWPPWSFLVTPTLCLHFLSSFFLLIQFTPFLFWFCLITLVRAWFSS